MLSVLHPRGLSSAAGCRCAPLWLLIGLLSLLLVTPLGPLVAQRAVAEEESQPVETPAEEEVEADSCSLGREELELRVGRAVGPLLAPATGRPAAVYSRAPRRAEHADRNGYGGPLRC